MWNHLDLKCPVADVCEYGIEDGLILHDLPYLVSLLTTSAEVLTEDNLIWTEMKIFQNVQTKYKRLLHCDKSLQLLQKVGTCLRKMVLLNLSKSYLDLAEHFLVGLQSTNSPKLLPSRQHLEYILIRTQSAAKLLCEGLHYSRETFCFLIQRLRVGHLITNLLAATSVTARLNILFKGILLQFFEFYRKLYSWHKKLKIGTWDWPMKLDLPEDLEVWLVPETSDLLKPKHVPNAQLQFLNRFLKKKHSGIDRNCIKQIVDISGENENNENSILDDTSDNIMQTDDLGEVTSRSDAGRDVSSILDDNTDNIMQTEDFGEVISRSAAGREETPRCHPTSDLKRKISPGKDAEIQVLETPDKDSKLIEEILIHSGEKSDKQTVRLKSGKKGKRKTITSQSGQNSVDSSLTPVRKIKKLNQQQKQLLKNIKDCTTFEQLNQIWQTMDVSTVNLLPKVLLPAKIRLIDKLLLKLKKSVETPGSSKEMSDKKKMEGVAVKYAGLRFAKLLGFTSISSKTKNSNGLVQGPVSTAQPNPTALMKPVRTLKELKQLYLELCHRLTVAEQHDMCAKLKRTFRSRKNDILLLKQSGEKDTASDLIFCTSKVFLTKFQL